MSLGLNTSLCQMEARWLSELNCLFFCPGRRDSRNKRSQKTAADLSLHAETEFNRVTDEVNLFSLGTRKPSGESIVENGDNNVHIQLCAEPFQEEMGISFKKGARFLVPVQSQSKTCVPWSPLENWVKDVNTLLLRDDKVKPVWHWRTSQ